MLIQLTRLKAMVNHPFIRLEISGSDRLCLSVMIPDSEAN
jgi:hypothetical protein